MILVADSSSLIALSRIGRLDLLREIGDGVCIPPAVRIEVLSGRRGAPGSQAIAGAKWLRTQTLADPTLAKRLSLRLGKGESEAIALAVSLGSEAIVVLDDAPARRAAAAEGVRVVGLLGLLVHAKQSGRLRSVAPILDELVAAGFHIDTRLRARVLRQAGEMPA